MNNDHLATSLASWLRCPICEQPLEVVLPLTLGCSTGHRYDVHKRGYITLLGPGSSKLIGDSAPMLDARDGVLESGAFAPIATAVARAAVGPRIVDAGAGTGYYLREALSQHREAQGLAFDLSPTAVARASRSSDRIVGLIADTWRPLPLRTGVADTVLDIFAPRNLTEFHRVLRAGGTLIVVVPRADHLVELRASTAMLDIPSDKADDVIASAEPLFALDGREHILSALTLEPGLASALVGMGPSAHHGASPMSEVGSTTLSVDLLRFRSR